MPIDDAADAFALFDRDDSGLIDRAEFASALKRLDVMANGRELDAVFAAADADRSGSIDYKEFLAALKAAKVRRDAAAAVAAADHKDASRE